MEEAFGGCGYSALQRAALLQPAWDQVLSGLDGREAVFGLHASSGAGGVAPPMVVLVRKLRPAGEWSAGVYPGRPASKGPEQAAEGAASSPQNASISTGTLNAWATKQIEGCLLRGRFEAPEVRVEGDARQGLAIRGFLLRSDVRWRLRPFREPKIVARPRSGLPWRDPCLQPVTRAREQGPGSLLPVDIGSETVGWRGSRRHRIGNSFLLHTPMPPPQPVPGC